MEPSSKPHPHWDAFKIKLLSVLKVENHLRTEIELTFLSRFLKEINFLEELLEVGSNNEALYKAASSLVYRSQEKDETIYKRGDKPEQAYVIVNGCVSMQSECNENLSLISSRFPIQRIGEHILFDKDELMITDIHLETSISNCYVECLLINPNCLESIVLSKSSPIFPKKLEILNKQLQFKKTTKNDNELVNMVGGMFKSIKYYGGELVTTQDELSKKILFIVSGEANVQIKNEEDDAYLIYKLNSEVKFILGDQSVLENQKMPYTCIAKNTLYCYYIDNNDIESSYIPEDMIYSMRNDLKSKLKLMNLKFDQCKSKNECVDLGYEKKCLEDANPRPKKDQFNTSINKTSNARPRQILFNKTVQKENKRCLNIISNYYIKLFLSDQKPPYATPNLVRRELPKSQNPNQCKSLLKFRSQAIGLRNPTSQKDQILLEASNLSNNTLNNIADHKRVTNAFNKIFENNSNKLEEKENE